MGVPVGRKGAGQITVTSFSVPLGSLPAWRKRLAARGVTTTPEATRFGEEFIAFQDPSGLDLELVATDRDARLPWVTGEVYSEMAIRGVHSVTLSIRAPEASIGFLTGLLGWSIVERNEQRTRLGVEEGGPGQRLDILHTPDAQPALNGLGTVHHLAMAIGTPEEQLAARAELIARGYHVTEVRDRQYFLSIYFREPGGVLYEIATMAPGFAVDEEASRLGRALKLPPWEEPHRAMIEAGLPAVSFPAP
jgi:glyoxalase family protein